MQYCGGFCHTLTWISHRCTCVPHSKIPSHFPPHPIPLGCPSVWTLSHLFHAWNLDRSSILPMVIYMFQCYSLKSSHPHPSPTESKSLFFISVSLLLSCIIFFLTQESKKCYPQFACEVLEFFSIKRYWKAKDFWEPGVLQNASSS